MNGGQEKLKFIDLFAGIGGFHVALEKLDFQCVFASELRVGLSELYEENFGIKPKRLAWSDRNSNL